jgi:hypothetical protein
VFIAAHNAGPCIAEAIGSCLEQSYQPVEVVVVDDASTDGTCDVMTDLDDARVNSLGRARMRDLVPHETPGSQPRPESGPPASTPTTSCIEVELAASFERRRGWDSRPC